jgi:hypothetical protein
MAEPVPSAEEILRLAHDIVQYAVARRAYVELHWPPEGSGTGADYALLHQRYAWIVDAFSGALALGPGPDTFDDLIHTIETCETILSDSAGAMNLASPPDLNAIHNRAVSLVKDTYKPMLNEVNGDLVDWHGDAATVFRENFLGALPSVRANQALLASSLRSAMVATRAIYAQYRRDLHDIATKAKAALHPSGRCGPPDLKVVLGLTAAAAKIAAGVATLEEGSGAFVIGEGATEAVSILVEASSGEGRGEERFVITGATTDDILDSATELVQRAYGFLGDREHEIIDSLNQNQAVVTGQLRALFLAGRPAITSVASESVTRLWNQFYR